MTLRLSTGLMMLYLREDHKLTQVEDGVKTNRIDIVISTHFGMMFFLVVFLAWILI